jgi:hypothetical protein
LSPRISNSVPPGVVGRRRVSEMSGVVCVMSSKPKERPQPELDWWSLCSSPNASVGVQRSRPHCPPLPKVPVRLSSSSVSSKSLSRGRSGGVSRSLPHGPLRPKVSESEAPSSVPLRSLSRRRAGGVNRLPPHCPPRPRSAALEASPGFRSKYLFPQTGPAGLGAWPAPRCRTPGVRRARPWCGAGSRAGRPQPSGRALAPGPPQLLRTRRRPGS